MSSHMKPTVGSDEKDSLVEDTKNKEITSSSKVEQKRKSTKKRGTAFQPIERRNWLIHLHYVRREYARCKELIKEELEQSKGKSDYALHIKATILRTEGDVEQSLKVFQHCHKLNPNNVNTMKQIGKNLILVGKHKSALVCYNAATEMSGSKDWEICNSQAICYKYLKQYDQAVQFFHEALQISKHVITYKLLFDLHMEFNNVELAKKILQKGVECFSENVKLVTSLGLLYLQEENYHKAFELLGKSLAYDPENYKAILAAGSLMQMHGDYDVAMSKYRIAAKNENSSLWNNIAMCFFGKEKLVAAVSCLKRANYLSPFDWKILHNLALVHLSTKQFASAFHFASTAIKINKNLPQTYLLLAVSLVHLGQYTNAEQAFKEALSLAPNDAYIVVNFASFLHQVESKPDESIKLISSFKSLKKKHSTELSKEVVDAFNKLMSSLNMQIEEPKKKNRKSKGKSTRNENNSNSNENSEKETFETPEVVESKYT